MKNTINFLTWKYIKLIMIYVIITFLTWLLEGIFGELKLKLEDMTNNILIFISSIEISSFQKVTGILCLLAIFFTWLMWYLKEYKQSKKEYFDLIEDKIEFNKTNLDFLRLKDILGRQPDYIDLAKNFSDESLKLLGYNDEQIRGINKYRNK